MMLRSPTSVTAMAETTSFNRAAHTSTRALTARISGPTLWGSTQLWRTSNNSSASKDCQLPTKRGPRFAADLFLSAITTYREFNRSARAIIQSTQYTVDGPSLRGDDRCMLGAC